VIINHTIIFIVGPQFLSNSLKLEKLCGSRKITLPQLQNSVDHQHSDLINTEL